MYLVYISNIIINYNHNKWYCNMYLVYSYINFYTCLCFRVIVLTSKFYPLSIGYLKSIKWLKL